MPGFGSALQGIASGLMGNSGAPFEAGEDQLNQYYNQAQQAQNPFYQMGTGAIPGYQQWVQGMQDPSGWINKQMGNYQQSPWAQYQTQQAMRAAQNMGSASGMTGSTPLMQFAQQQAAGIGSQDMQNWLQNVLGINTMYGQGMQNQVQGGQNAANSLTNLASNMGNNMAQMEIGRTMGENKDQNDLWGGLINAGGTIASMFL